MERGNNNSNKLCRVPFTIIGWVFTVIVSWMMTILFGSKKTVGKNITLVPRQEQSVIHTNERVLLIAAINNAVNVGVHEKLLSNHSFYEIDEG